MVKTKQNKLILSFLALSATHLYGMEKKQISLAPEEQTPGATFHEFLDLAGDCQQEVLNQLVPMYLSGAHDLKALFNRIGSLSSVSKTFLKQLSSVCYDGKVLKNVFETHLSAPFWKMAPKELLCDILLNLSNKITSKKKQRQQC